MRVFHLIFPWRVIICWLMRLTWIYCFRVRRVAMGGVNSIPTFQQRQKMSYLLFLIGSYLWSSMTDDDILVLIPDAEHRKDNFKFSKSLSVLDPPSLISTYSTGQLLLNYLLILCPAKGSMTSPRNSKPIKQTVLLYYSYLYIYLTFQNYNKSFSFSFSDLYPSLLHILRWPPRAGKFSNTDLQLSQYAIDTVLLSILS